MKARIKCTIVPTSKLIKTTKVDSAINAANAAIIDNTKAIVLFMILLVYVNKLETFKNVFNIVVLTY